MNNPATRLPAALTAWLEQQNLGRISEAKAVGGGCISEACVITTSQDERFFLKLNAATPDDFFLAEARSLQLIGRTGCVRVPEVYHAGPDFILMEFIAAGTQRTTYWSELGEALANLHNQPADHFGFAFDTYCGSTLQPNPVTQDGYRFFAEQRLMYQARLARDQRLLERSDTRRIDLICEHLAELVPFQAPALLHGDLWAGNMHCTAEGAPCLIDPAAYYGWPEADLAMTQLFGGFGSGFLPAYLAVRKLEPDFAKRVPVYNLYHLLNHLNLFGGSYLSQVREILVRFAG